MKVVSDLTQLQGAYAQTSGSISLQFPLRRAVQGSTMVCDPCTPWNAGINSVFDHSMTNAYSPKNSKVVAFTGESGDRNSSQDGYKNCGGSRFIVNGNYTASGLGQEYLFYDGHPRIDYRAGAGTEVYAAISGTVRYPSSITNIDNAGAHHVLEIDPEDGSGYKVYYLHFSTDPQQGNPSCIFDYNINACNPNLPVAGAHVIAGQLVGKVGGWGSPNGASQYPAHLHFEVHKNINNKYIPVDPYGWIGGRPDIGLPDPYASLDHYGMLASSIPRDINSNLWQNSTPPGQPPIARFTMQSGSVQKRENEVLNLTVPPGSTAPVDFSAVLSFDPDGTIPTYKDAYRWYVNGNLQDGEPNEPCAGRSFSKNFPAGTWQILLIVQDNQGTIGAVGASIVVTDGSVPTASTVAATNVTANSATLNGTVNPNGLSTTVYFQWGTTTAYGNTTPSQSIGSGTSNVGVSANLSGLSPSTTYHYRVVATNNAGTTYGADVAFTTAPITSGCTVTPISIGQTMNGALSMSDCPSPVRGSSYYADRYSFSASAGQQVAILLTSSAFDTYLYLIGPNNSVIAQDDDGGGGNNSRIPPGSGFYSLPSSGTYIIEVTSYAANATGTYTLSLSTNSNIVIFQDNMESGSGSWSAQSPWGLTTSAAYSPTHSWTDSPAGNYSNNANVSLWSPFLNFSGLSSVTLTFQHRYDLESGYDFGRVWVTTDNGTTFTQIASFTGTNTAWAQTTIDLSAFAGRPSVRIVFQLLSDASITRDGWYIDDVLVTGR